MPRVARVMIEGWPFHLTHRGNHRKDVFHSDEERGDYLTILRQNAQRFEMAIWAYCLMPNHVHLLVVGRQRSSIARAIGNAHREFSRRCNLARAVTGHAWANRYYSTPLDETHVWAAVRYIELNPVRAGLVRRATEFTWSSARSHAGLVSDELLGSTQPFPGPVSDWSAWLDIGLEQEATERLRQNTQTGMPTGDEEFLSKIERRLGRAVGPKKPGPLGKSRGLVVHPRVVGARPSQVKAVPRTQVRETFPFSGGGVFSLHLPGRLVSRARPIPPLVPFAPPSRLSLPPPAERPAREASAGSNRPGASR